MSKSVLVVVPKYPMSTLKLTKSVEMGINKILKHFLWEESNETRRVPLLSWEIAREETINGTAAIKNIDLQNIALGAKLKWKLYRSPNSLWCHVVRAKYLDSNEPEKIPTIANTHLSSHIWKCPTITNHITWQIGSGILAKFWLESSNRYQPLTEMDNLAEFNQPRLNLDDRCVANMISQSPTMNLIGIGNSWRSWRWATKPRKSSELSWKVGNHSLPDAG